MASTASIARNLGDSLTDREREFFRLVILGDASQLKQYLKLNFTQIDFGKRNEQGNTALDLAVKNQNGAIISLLLSTGQFMPLDDILCFATEYGYETGVNLILQHLTKPRLRFFIRQNAEEDLNVQNSDDRATNESLTTILQNVSEDDNKSQEEVYEDYDLVMDSCVTKTDEDGKRPSDVFRSISNPPLKRSSLHRSFSSPDGSVDIFNNAIQRKESLYFKKLQESESSVSKALVCLKDPASVLRKAAIAENFVVAQVLVNAGVRIAEPLETEKKKDSVDSLQDTNERIENYRALSTATYMSLLAEDPIRMSFERSKKFKELDDKYPENKETFEELSEYCSNFAVDLLNECKSASEVKKLLCQDRDFIPGLSTVKFGRLHFAVEYGQRKFIAHPSCQHVVSVEWISGLSEWNQWCPFQKTIHVIKQAFLMLFLFLPYIFSPDSKLSAPVRVPLNRFIHSVICYCFFLGCVSFAILQGKNENPWIVYITLIWMVTHLIKLIFTDFQTQTSQFWNFWNLYDLLMASIFVLSSVVHMISDDFDLRVFDEGLFSIGVILAFLRILQWFHMHRILGPFIVSLRKILRVITQILIVFIIVYVAFILAVYSLYSGRTFIDEEGINFSDLESTVSNLYWTLFGYSSGSVKVIQKTNSNMLIDYLGNGLWGLFHVAAVIILMNLLIAMMTNTFQKVQNNCDVEWKFARTQFWMSYFEDDNALPPPFNFFIFIKNFILCIRNSKPCNKRQQQVGKNRSTLKWKTMPDSRSDLNINTIEIAMNSTSEASTKTEEDDYSVFINTLLRRYWHSRRVKDSSSKH